MMTMIKRRISLKQLLQGNEIGMHMNTNQLWGYKKVQYDNKGYTGECIAKVLIPPGTKIIRPSNESNNKHHAKHHTKHQNYLASNQLRANKLIVTGFYSIRSNERLPFFSAKSLHCKKFEYNIGHYKMPDKFDENIHKKCTNGLHFYFNLEQAKKHNGE